MLPTCGLSQRKVRRKRQEAKSRPLHHAEAGEELRYDSAGNYSDLGAGILPVVKYCSISSRVRPLVSGRKRAAVRK